MGRARAVWSAGAALPGRAVRAARSARVGWPVWSVAGVLGLACLPVGGGRVADAASAALVALAAAVTAPALVGRRAGGGPVLGRGAAVALGAAGVALAVATATATDPVAGLAGFVRCAQVFVLVPLAVALLLRSHREARQVAWCLVGVALAQGAVGVAQYATGSGASYMGENVRAVGTFGAQHVMGMATVVSYGLVVALALACGTGSGRGRAGRRRGRQRRVLLGCAAGLVVPLAVSFSRGAWLATAAAVAVVAAVAALPRHPRTVAVAACAAGLLLLGGAATALTADDRGGAGDHGGGQAGGLVGGMVGQRLGSIGEAVGLGGGAPDQSVTDRYAMWSAALAMWREEPLTGVGPGGFAEHRDGHASLALSAGGDVAGAGVAFRRQELLSPHNMYLLLLSEQGLLGAAAVVGCWAAVGVACVARLRRAPPDERGLGLAVVGLLTWQAVHFVYGDIGGPTSVLTAVVLGLAAWWGLAPRRAAGAVPRHGCGVGS